jgi:hypothetical protein
MKNWCKIIELEEDDVLVQRTNNEDGETVVFSCRLETHDAKVSMEFESEEEADTAFATITEQDCKNMLKVLKLEIL